jgi:hypothetical protein
MTQIKNKKGRKKSDNPKKTWLKVRVTDQMYAMLKEANKSQMINDGLAILMPTLGKKWDGEKWLKWEHEGTANLMVVYNALNFSIDDLKSKDQWPNKFMIGYLEALRTQIKYDQYEALKAAGVEHE